MNEDQKRVWTKIATGLILAVAGGFGIVFGRNLKQRFLRISILILSALSLGAGFYLMIDGTTDLALGRVDQYQLGGPAQQTMTFSDPVALKESLKPVIEQQPRLRRLKYSCPDGSKSLTVYLTSAGIFGVPQHSVTCDDGMKLVEYTTN